MHAPPDAAVLLPATAAPVAPKFTAVAAVALAAALAPALTADVLYDNGDTDGNGGTSNAHESVFGSRRTLLDDFVVPAGETWRLTTLHHLHIWNTLPAGSGETMEIAIWSDADGTPGQKRGDVVVTGYEEVATGRIFFSREEAESWTTFEPVDLGPGHWWFEATVVGPENNFWLEHLEVFNDQSWVNYSDLEGLRSAFQSKFFPYDLAWSIDGHVVDPVRFRYLDDPPETVRPCGGTARVEIRAPGGAALDAGSPALHLDDGTGFVTVPLERLSFALYNVVFPPIECGRAVRYFLSAATDDGTVFTDPPLGPLEPRRATAALALPIVFADDMEEDRGWTVQNEGIDQGPWERGAPPGSERPYEPDRDFDGSGQCWVTGLEALRGVHEGTTRLISPTLDLDGAADAVVRYARWYGDSGGSNQIRVDVSGNGGSTWIPLEGVPHRNGWQPREVRIGDFLAPTSQVRLRFVVSGKPFDVAEGGLDAVRVLRVECTVGFPGDLDLDGDVDFEDLLALLAAWGPCPPEPGGCPEDLDGSGDVGFADLIILLAAWQPCG